MMLLLLLTTALALHSSHIIDVEASITGGSRHNNLPQLKRKSFLWIASLDRYTGVATSFEQSIFQEVDVGHRGDGYGKIPLTSSSSNNMDGTEVTTKQQQQIVREIFTNYPDFLGRSSLTLGLCRAVRSYDDGNDDVRKQKQQQQQYKLQTSLLPLNLLTFGMPRVVSSKKSSSRFENNVHQSTSGGTTIGKVICCIEIPIVGGLLARLSEEDSSTSSSSSSSSSSTVKNRNIDHGCLRFTWLQTTENQNNTILITEIAGKYRPTLAGCKTPIPTWRNAMYCSTQRMVHAHVMWRFHGFAVREYQHKIL